MNIMTRTPRILEDVPRPERRKLLGLSFAKNDNKPTIADHAAALIALGGGSGEPPETPPSGGEGEGVGSIPPVIKETDHQKVFRLVGERKYPDAARLAKRLIDAGNVAGFFIYGNNPAFRKASDAFSANVATSRRGAFTEIQTVGPEWAQAILLANDDNRLINVQGLVDRLRDIADGRWQLNGQGLVIAKSGELNDGQHRLWAILLSGTPVRIPVFYGAQRDTRATLDTGKIRLTRDRFKFAGIPNDTRVAAIVNLVHRIVEGRDATEAEKIAYYHQQPEFYQVAAQVSNGLPKGTPVASVSAAAFLLLKNRRDEETLRKFFREVRGTDVPAKGYASFALFKALLDKNSKLLGNNAAQQVFTVMGLYQKWENHKRQPGTIQVLTESPEKLVA